MTRHPNVSHKQFGRSFLLYVIVSCVAGCVSYSQSINLDLLLKQIEVEKNDSARFYLAFSGLTESETNPVDDMGKADTILVFGQKHNDLVCQVMGLSCLGYDYQVFGNTAKS